MNPIDALMHKCQEQEKYIKKLECNVEDHRVALANVKWELREVQRECNEAEAKLELQPCGHPVACIVQGEQVGPGEFVHYCGWCQSLDVARWQAKMEERQWNEKVLAHVLALAERVEEQKA